MLFALIALAAVPTAPSLPELSPPLGHVSTVVEDSKGGLAPGSVLITREGCAAQAVSLMRFLGGTARAVEQLEQWLGKTQGLEKKLFVKRDTLADVIHLLADAKLEPQKACTAPTLVDGYKLELTAPPRKFCAVDAGRGEGDFWFFTNDRPTAVVNVSSPSGSACTVRLSAVLFDASGRARLRYHADWTGTGTLSATLLGDGCQEVEFPFNPDKLVFQPVLKSCKH